jgi:hypothetical protein
MKKKPHALYTAVIKVPKIPVLFFLCAVFCSCVGISMDITVRADGSGTMALEYRVSRMAEALGKLDGNERWNTVPVGRADFERTMARLPKLRLSSFSSSENDGDVITRAEISYKNFKDILAFLDPKAEAAPPDGRGSRAKYTQEGGVHKLFMLIADSAEIDTDIHSLAETVFSGYSLHFSLSVPGTAALSLTDYSGNIINAPPGLVQVVSHGKKVSVTMDMSALFEFPDGLGMEFTW